ncbi:MAG: hypothetical protein QM737_12245 [Ferruginibacter sp.]
MRKIQHGIAGFFSGVFIGFLIILIERKFIDNNEHAALLFIVNAFTVLICGIVGIAKGLRIEKRKSKK